MNTNKLAKLSQYIESADLALQQAREILTELGGDKISYKLAKNKAKNLINAQNGAQDNENLKIIEGVFNGQNMVGPDGKEYSVPANYASKSKLVEGDILKLTIQSDGSFVYKQINPVERERTKGEIVMDEVTGTYSVLMPDGRKFNVLTASVTYFKGEPGDQAIILIPKNKTSQWAAIENIIKKEEEKEETLNADQENQEDKQESKEDKNSNLGQSSDTEPDPGSSSDNENLNSENSNLNNNHVELGNIDDGYQGITKHAQYESILPTEDDEQEDDEQNQKSEQERQKIEAMINNEDLDIDDLDKKDLEDL